MGDRSLLLTFCASVSLSEGSHGEKWSVPWQHVSGFTLPWEGAWRRQKAGGQGCVRGAHDPHPAQARPPGRSGCRGAWLYLASMEHQGCSVGASFLTHGISPQARSPSPAPIATAPSLTAPTCAPTFRPTPT